MSAILTLDYRYTQPKQPWFTKQFSDFAELFKWLREDSIIILPKTKLNEEFLKKNLILTKLALPKVRIIVLSEEDNNQKQPFFTYTNENNLDSIIQQAIVNQLEIIDNRKNLAEIINHNSIL